MLQRQLKPLLNFKRLVHVKANAAPTPKWAVSDSITEKKSVFVGRAVKVSSSQQAIQLLNDLKQNNKQIRKATHNIVAWSIMSMHKEEHFDNDGEPPAGERVLDLLRKTQATNVMVVVTRWYGGVQLGGARFKHVGKCAHEALKRGNFL